VEPAVCRIHRWRAIIRPGATDSGIVTICR
jgi:hypothetical protein